jgi:hypothetical protein
MNHYERLMHELANKLLISNLWVDQRVSDNGFPYLVVEDKYSVKCYEKSPPEKRWKIFTWDGMNNLLQETSNEKIFESVYSLFLK